MKIANAIFPWAAGISVLCFVIGLPIAVGHITADYQQGETVRIMYMHVPAAWMASMIYGAMAVSSAVYLIWRHTVAHIIARGLGPHWRDVHSTLPRHRYAVGRTHVGHVVGVGCAPHLNVNSVLPLSRLHRAG